MRIIFSLLLPLIAIAAGASTEIKWLNTEHDFGAFDENDGKVSCDFKFVNSGSEPVAIITVHTTCGCTTSSYTKGPVAPGDTAVIHAQFNPIGRAGRFEKNIYVDCNTTPRRTTLAIKGVVVGSSNTVRSKFPVEAGPLKLRGDVIAFGEIQAPRMTTFYLDAYNTASDTIYPHWKNLPPYITVNNPGAPVAPGDFHTFALSFDSFKCKDYGVINNEFELIPDTRSPQSKTIKSVAIVSEDFSRLTPAQRAKAPVISVSPTRIELPPPAPGTKQVTCMITITNKGKDPLLVRRVYSADTGVTVADFPKKIKKGASASIIVNINLDQITTPAVNARVAIVTNAPESPTTIVRIAGDINQ
ncbi:MAG: DUF1573 domain-containing protein [Muribaculaceae bacterium]|nr:DUF1573 domain-containing protein [Muribaculaceae bacterium]